MQLVTTTMVSRFLTDLFLAMANDVDVARARRAHIISLNDVSPFQWSFTEFSDSGYTDACAVGMYQAFFEGLRTQGIDYIALALNFASSKNYLV